MSSYPEHEKLAKVQNESQAIGEFLEHMGDQGVRLMRWQESNGEPEHIDPWSYHNDGAKKRVPIFSLDESIINPDYIPEGWVTYGDGIQRILAEYFDIDYDKLMKEKDQMLEDIRSKQSD